MICVKLKGWQKWGNKMIFFCGLDVGYVMVFVLIGFIDKVISIIFKKMLTYTGSFKPKPKNASEMPTQYTSCYPLDNNRRSLATAYPVPKKEKVYRKVNTESNQPDTNNDFMKYASKAFKPQSKGASPIVKKNLLFQNTSPASKLCFSNNQGKIKRLKKTANLNDKAFTQTGPIIQRTVNAEQPPVVQKEKEKQKVILLVQEKTHFLESKKQNYIPKRHDSKTNFNLYMKARLHTEGTMDSTPPMMTSYDVQLLELIGQGTFGKVFKGRYKKTGEIVAVKKVFQDPKYKNREVEIVNMLKGDFVMKVMGTYSTFQEGGQFLNIVMTYYQGDIYNLIKQNGRKGLSTMDIKIFSYQIFRGLLFIHQLKVAHRDIKPHNILYKGKKAAICDFGSAKILTHEPNLPYICSRCYRAPELIFGATHYSTMIDIWSVGCVLLEMIQGTPLFIGQNSVDHLIEIIKVLGTPTKSQVIDMNPNYDLNDYKFPKVKKREWNKIFPKTDPLLLDLLSQIMIYSPKQRLNAAEALAHDFYDELREEPVARAILKQYGVNLFSFMSQELKGHEHLIPKLIPPWHQEYKDHSFF